MKIRATASQKVLDKRVHGVLKEPGEVRGETIAERAKVWQKTLQSGGAGLNYDDLHENFRSHSGRFRW